MTQDLFWFIEGDDAAWWLVNNRLQVHLIGFGFSEAAD